MSANINFDGGLTLSLPVSDLDASIGWYQEKLGFNLMYRVDELGWCEMVSPVERVSVGLSQVETPTPGGATPTFGVEDIEAARSTLASGGVWLDGDIIVHEGMVKLLTFYDPDGNALMLYEDLSETPA